MRKMLWFVAIAAWVSGCVTSGTHDKVLAELDQTKNELQNTKSDLEKTKQACESERSDLTGKLTQVSKKGEEQDAMLASMNTRIGELTGEKTQLSEKQQKLRAQIEELERMRVAAEKRQADFKRLVMKLKKMMDAGTLAIKPRNGLLVVQMSSDVVFPPASTQIKPAAREAIAELAQTLATFEGRRFQVIGHSDNVPIRSARFPSNWELSAARAVEVVKLLVENGVKPEMISAAGNAEFDPLVENDTPEDRATNRRVEIVFLPKIDEMPGFDEVLKG
jgi:chemotaxis protein MotB